jgi:twitching motility protein PilI
VAKTPELAALVEQPFELLEELERRSRAAFAGKGGFRIGQEQFVASRDQVGEVLMLPESMTRVPGAKRWMLGIANLRGHLLPLVDLAAPPCVVQLALFRSTTGKFLLVSSLMKCRDSGAS